MDGYVWILIILIVIVIVFVIVAGIFRRNPPPSGGVDIPGFANAYAAANHWSKDSPGPDSPQNTCLLYTFPPVRVGGQVGPGGPTMDPAVIGTLRGVSAAPGGCIDIDQAFASQVVHTCVPTFPGAPDERTVCYRADGTLGAVGETEIYFSQGACSTYAPPVCPGELAAIALNFGQTGGTVCLSKGATGAAGEGAAGPAGAGATGMAPIPLTVAPCDLSDPNQIFRLTRIDPGQDPATLQPAGGKSGLIGQIFDRASGLCVEAQGPPDFPLTLGLCKPSGGYDWLFAPSIDFGSGAAPQQIAYVGGLDITGLLGATGATGARDWIVENNVKSMSFSGSKPLLQPYALTASGPQTAQYIDYPIYNIISKWPPCTPTTTGLCFGF